MKTGKKMISIILSLLLALGAVSAGSVPAAAESTTSFDQKFRDLSAELEVGTENYFKVIAVRSDTSPVENVYLKAVKEPDGLAVYESSDLES